MQYITNSGLKLEGTLDQIKKICVATGETLDSDKLSEFDTKEYYRSSTHGLVEIGKMAVPHIFNAVKKKISDYYVGLKVSHSTTITQFFTLLEGWTEDPEVKALVDELSKRQS